jgi:hypothetical protein
MRYELSNKNTPRRPHCPACAQVMRLARITSRFGDLPDLYTFECLWRVAHRDRVTLGRRTNERRRRNPHLHLTYASHSDMDEAFCARMRAAIELGLESAPLGVITTPGTRNPKYCNKAGDTLPPGQRLLVLVEAAFLACPGGGTEFTSTAATRYSHNAAHHHLCDTDRNSDNGGRFRSDGYTRIAGIF